MDIPRNPVVLRALNQARKVVNALIRKYGSPHAVHIEMARDLSRPIDERRKIERDQADYRTKNEDARKAFASDFGLKDQIQRASVSIMANVAEGFDACSNIEFLRFLGYARRSSVEVKSHLYIALDLNYISEGSFTEMIDQTQKCTALIKGFYEVPEHLNT